MLSHLLLIGALLLLVRVLVVWSGAYSRWQQRQIEYDRYEHIVQQDPTQAGSWAELAKLHYEDGEIERAIELWRTAIRALPHGPFSENWKRKLKQALLEQEAVARGESVEFGAYRACDHCEKLISSRARICPECGGVNSMSPLEFLRQPAVARSWIKETIAITIVLWIAGIVFSALPLEWKGVVIMATVLVGGWLILRAMNGNV